MKTPPHPGAPARRHFLIILAAAGLGPGLAAGLHAAPDVLPQLRDVKRIVFLGDSITQGGDYVADIECWLVSKGQEVEALNLGLGSETASDLTAQENSGHLKQHGFGRPFVSERLARVLAATKPDLVFACYGMNDAGSLPAGETGTKRYGEAALKAGAREVVFSTPPIRECKADEWDRNTHDQDLGLYSEWLLARKAQGWSVVDIHGPMRRALDAARTSQPAFAFSKDGVHPGREGHWVMASCILGQYFGAKLEGVASAEALFPAHGAEIRTLVVRRMKLRFDAWMASIGHTRPGVPGGPGARPAPSVEEATAKAADLTRQIQALVRQGT
jgi:lysophospholipase L1-like esterase